MFPQFKFGIFFMTFPTCNTTIRYLIIIIISFSFSFCIRFLPTNQICYLVGLSTKNTVAILIALFLTNTHRCMHQEQSGVQYLAQRHIGSGLEGLETET